MIILIDLQNCYKILIDIKLLPNLEDPEALKRQETHEAQPNEWLLVTKLAVLYSKAANG